MWIKQGGNLHNLDGARAIIDKGDYCEAYFPNGTKVKVSLKMKTLEGKLMPKKSAAKKS